MIRTIRVGLAVALTTLLTSTLCLADTWTDASGNFSIEAEYVRVEGSSIVLRKADGTTINVPISKLSTESRALAKKLYEASRSGAAPQPASPAATASGGGNPAAMAPNGIDISGGSSQPTSAGSMAAYPADASLQQAVDHVRDQILAGHPEVIWHAMPTSMRNKLDSDEVRVALKPMIEQQAQVSKPVEDVLKKVLEVLRTQKEFVLNSSMVKSQIPPPMMPMVKQAYDPAVGILYEFVAMQFAFQKTGDKTFTEVIDYHGPRIGGHMKALMPLVPPGAIDQMMSQIQVAETGPNSGTVTIPNNEGGQQVIEMVRYEDRWIPKDLAETWDQSNDSLVQEMSKAMEMANQNPQQMQQATMMVTMIAGTANQMLDPLAKASSQEEFDAAIMQLMGLASMFGGGGPGGPGGFPGGGAPGGGFPPAGAGGPDF